MPTSARVVGCAISITIVGGSGHRCLQQQENESSKSWMNMNRHHWCNSKKNNICVDKMAAWSLLASACHRENVVTRIEKMLQSEKCEKRTQIVDRASAVSASAEFCAVSPFKLLALWQKCCVNDSAFEWMTQCQFAVGYCLFGNQRQIIVHFFLDDIRLFIQHCQLQVLEFVTHSFEHQYWTFFCLHCVCLCLHACASFSAHKTTFLSFTTKEEPPPHFLQVFIWKIWGRPSTETIEKCFFLITSTENDDN